MEKIAQYDPLAINAIQFNIKSVKKYTSIASILISLAIITISIVVNLESIKHIWIPISELPVTFTVSKFSQTPQSQGNPICVASLQAFQNTPKLTVTKIVQGQLVDEIRDPLDGVGELSYLQNYVKGKYFVCFDLAGVLLREQEEKIEIETGTALSQIYEIIFRKVTVNEILYETEPSVQKILISDVASYTNTIYLDYIQVDKRDSLLFNQDPQIIKGFYIDPLQQAQINTNLFRQNSPQVTFQIRTSFTANKCVKVNKYAISRINIGEILSKVLAWRGLILIPIAFVLILLPFVQSFYKFDLIQARYTCPQLDSFYFTAYTEIKRKFSFICHMPKQRALNFAFQKIDDQLDILQILRKQILMKQNIAQVSNIQKPKDIFACEFQKQEKAELLQLQLNGSNLIIVGKNDEKQYNFKEEYLQEGFNTKIQQIVKLFDETETQIEVLANQGKGYGSSWNIIAVFLMSIGLLVGLILMGLFKVQPEFYSATVVPSDESEFGVILFQQQIAFRPNLETARRVPSQWHYTANIRDSKGNWVRSVAIINGSNCRVPPGGQNYNWFCFSEDVRLKNKGDEYEILVIKLETFSTNRIDLMFYRVLQTTFYSVQKNAEQDDEQVWFELKYKIVLVNLQLQVKKLVLDKNGIIDESFSLTKIYGNPQSGVEGGIFITANSRYDYIQIADASYWELLDNAWGLVILSFQLIIYRISRMINSAVKSRKIDAGREQQRSDILSILNDVDRLEKGAYNHQLCSIKHFFKQRIQQKDVYSHLH